MGISQPFDAREPSGRGLFAFVVAATHNRYTLTVDLIERRSFFTLGNWNALTRFKWRVQRENNSVIREGVSVGENHRSNMLGYATAKAVSQDAFDPANGILRNWIYLAVNLIAPALKSSRRSLKQSIVLSFEDVRINYCKKKGSNSGSHFPA